MTQTNKNSDHQFSSFAVGVSIGVVAALLFGTEEGRKIVKEALDAIPEKYKKVPEVLSPSKEGLSRKVTASIIPSFETPHHATYDFEAPPPPAPTVNLTRPQKDIL